MASSRRAGGSETISDYEGVSPDYTEGQLTNWETDTDYDLTDGTEVLEVYKEGASGALWDDANVTLQDAVSTDIPRIIRPASGNGHSGIPLDDGSCAGFDSDAANDQHVIGIRETGSYLQDLVLYRSGGTNQAYYIFAKGWVANSAYCVGVLAWGCACRGFQTLNTINCLAHDVSLAWYDYTGSTRLHYNCTEHGSTNALLIDATCVITSKNCVWDNTVTNNGTHNETTNTNSTPTYVSVVGHDFHLDSEDTVALDNGTDLSSDGTFAFDDDIDGDTISTWSIGFDSHVAAAGLSIDVYDSPTLAENIGPSSPLAGVSRFDTVEVQEVIDALTSLFGNTSYDQINVTEFIDAIMHLVAEAGDDVDITELIQSVMSGGYTSVAQDIEVTEDITSVMDAKTEPAQAVTVNEYVEMLLQIAGQANITVNDLMNVIENIQAKMSDLITSKYDQLVLTEVISLSLVIQLSKFDTIQISEYLLSRMSGLASSPYESVEVSESVDGQVPLAGLDKAEVIALQEAITVSLPEIITPSIDDDIGISEAITSRMSGAAISLAQIIEVVESVEAQVRLGVIDKSDNIEIAETILTKMGAAILSAYEQINVSEYPYGRMADAALSPFQSVAISEAVSLSVSVPMYLTSIAFALAQRQATFSLAQRSMSFSLAKRSMTFSLN